MYTLQADLTLIDFIRNWINSVKRTEVKDSTLDRLRISADGLASYSIARQRVCDIAISDFQGYVQELVAAGYAYTTIRKQMQIVSAPMQYAYVNRIIPFNPCPAVKVPARANVLKASREVVAYTPEQQEALIAIAHREVNIPWMVDEFMMCTGLRIGEAMALKWQDVSIEGRRMRIHSTMVNLRNGAPSYAREGAKSRTSNRTIPLSKRAVDILNQLSSFMDSEYVFGEVTYEAMRYHTQKLCAAAGVPYYGLHVWRHTFATNQYYKGTDVKILSRLLGHADASITYNIYIHLYGDGFDDMMRAVD